MEGKFVHGAYVEVSERYKQHIEINHQLAPYKASISLNGKPIQCVGYTLKQRVREFGRIELELPVTDVTITSDSGDFFIRVGDMLFKRVE